MSCSGAGQELVRLSRVFTRVSLTFLDLPVIARSSWIFRISPDQVRIRSGSGPDQSGSGPEQVRSRSGANRSANQRSCSRSLRVAPERCGAIWSASHAAVLCSSLSIQNLSLSLFAAARLRPRAASSIQDLLWSRLAAVRRTRPHKNPTEIPRQSSDFRGSPTGR